MCVIGGSLLVQRASSEFVAAPGRGDLCDRSMVAAASPVCCGEPAGLCHTGGSELGLHAGSFHWCNEDDVSIYLVVWLSLNLLLLSGWHLGPDFIPPQWSGSAGGWSLSEVPYWQTVQWPHIRGNQTGDAFTFLSQAGHSSLIWMHVFLLLSLLLPPIRCLTSPVSFVWVYLLKHPLANGHGSCC